MIENQLTKSDITNKEILLSRRRFFRNSGAAFLATTLLSSCNVIDDIFPKSDKSEDRDKTLAFFGDSLTIGAG
ncbi:MAG: hypothetical protein ABIN24_03085, partial [Dyadobacter sp.]